MEINKAISNQNVIITLKGRLDTMTAPQLDDEAKSIDFDEVETVTLNLKDLEYISGSIQMKSIITTLETASTLAALRNA